MRVAACIRVPGCRMHSAWCMGLRHEHSVGCIPDECYRDLYVCLVQGMFFNGRASGRAWVTFEAASDAAQALELDGSDMGGRTIEIFTPDSRPARQALRMVTEGQVWVARGGGEGEDSGGDADVCVCVCPCVRVCGCACESDYALVYVLACEIVWHVLLPPPLSFSLSLSFGVCALCISVAGLRP